MSHRTSPRALARMDREEWRRLVQLVREEQDKMAAEAEAKTTGTERGPMIHRYIRCSHEDSRRSGLGLEAQDAGTQLYCQMLLAREQYQDFALNPRLYRDEAVSAWKHHFIERGAGYELNVNLRPGDHIVFARLDRAFRNLRDLLSTTQLWRDRGVTVHFAEEGIVTGTTFGEFIMHILGAVAEMQARYISDRNKEAAARKRARLGGRGGRNGLRGFKVKKVFGRQLLFHDPHERRIMGMIVHLRDVEKLSWRKIERRIEEMLAKEQNRPVVAHYNNPRYPFRFCRNLYFAELKLRAEQAAAKGADGAAPASPPDEATPPSTPAPP